MLAKNSSGQVGLGSRLFLGKEATWGTAPTAWATYSIYNQPGSRPQKTMTPIDVPQLFPSMLRRKPLAGAVSVAGSYIFGLPKTNFMDFCELILGHDQSASTTTAIDLEGTTITIRNVSDTDKRLKIHAETATTLSALSVPGITALNGSNADADWVGVKVTIAGMTTGDTDDDAEILNINKTHTVASADVDSDAPTPFLILETVFDLADLTTVANNTAATAGLTVGVLTASVSALTAFSLQERNTKSWSMIQTLGVEKIAKYSGMKAQSATINVTTDSVTTIDVAFIGQDEVTKSALFQSTATTANLFGSSGLDPLTYSGDGTAKVVSGVSAGYDNFTDYYPSWATTLYIGKKSGPSDVSYNIVNSATTANSVENNDDITHADHEGDYIIPFSDFTITINNNLDFPAYINGTQTRNEPVQTTYKEVTGTMTIPFNEHTSAFVDGFFDQDHYTAELIFDDGSNTSIQVSLPEFCVVGDGGLANVPEGEITLPVSFGAYATVDADSEYDSTVSPITITVDETT